MVNEIDRRGHEIGSHSENHLHMNSLSGSKIENELKSVEKKLEIITGKKPVLFRPPFGEYNDNLIKTCNNLDYYVIQWDVEPLVTETQRVKLLKNQYFHSILISSFLI